MLGNKLESSMISMCRRSSDSHGLVILAWTLFPHGVSIMSQAASGCCVMLAEFKVVLSPVISLLVEMPIWLLVPSSRRIFRVG